MDTLYKNLDIDNLNVEHFKKMIDIKIKTLELPVQLHEYLSDDIFQCSYRDSISSFNTSDIVKHKKNSASHTSLDSIDIRCTKKINKIFNKSKFVIFDIHSCYFIIRYLIKLENINDTFKGKLITTLNKYHDIYPEYCKLIDVEKKFSASRDEYIISLRTLKNSYLMLKKSKYIDIHHQLFEYSWFQANNAGACIKMQEKIQDIANCRLYIEIRGNNYDVTIHKRHGFSIRTKHLSDIFSINKRIGMYKDLISEINCCAHNLRLVVYIFEHRKNYHYH
jgi:hypothetical protein